MKKVYREIILDGLIEMNAPEGIVNSRRLVERFGFWPSFHDAEVVSLTLDRRGENGPTAELLVHTWAMTDKIDERGYYVLENHTLVRFMLEKVVSCEFSELNRQNVLFGLSIEPEIVEGEPLQRFNAGPLSWAWRVGGLRPCDRR